MTTRYALYVELVAQPDKADEVADFLSSALPLALEEPDMPAWFAVRFDTHTFAIFDAFPTQAGRQAHLDGRIAEALMAKADSLLASTPTIRFADVLADKLPT